MSDKNKNIEEEKKVGQEAKNHNQAQTQAQTAPAKVETKTEAKDENEMKISFNDDVMLLGEEAVEEVDLDLLFETEEEDEFEDFKNYDIAGVFDGYRIADNGSGTTFSTYSIDKETKKIIPHTIKLRQILTDEDAVKMLNRELKFSEIEQHQIKNELNGREEIKIYYSAENVEVGRENPKAQWLENTSVDLTVSNVVVLKDFKKDGKKTQATELQSRFKKEGSNAYTTFNVIVVGKTLSPSGFIGKRIRANGIEIEKTPGDKIYYAKTVSYLR